MFQKCLNKKYFGVIFLQAIFKKGKKVFASSPTIDTENANKSLLNYMFDRNIKKSFPLFLLKRKKDLLDVPSALFNENCTINIFLLIPLYFPDLFGIY